MGEPFKLSEPKGAQRVKTKFLLPPISFFVVWGRRPRLQRVSRPACGAIPNAGRMDDEEHRAPLPASIDKRPSPDELLRRVQAEERRARRGRLKVFLG